MLSEITICSRALVKLGAQPITSFRESSAEASVSCTLYPQVRDGLLSSYPWSFATFQTVLPRLASVPISEFKHSYLLPPDFLRVVSAGSGQRASGLDYRIVEDRMHTNSQRVVLTYIGRPQENIMPAFFVQALVASLAAELCLPITDNSSKAEFLMKVADEEVRKARFADSSQATPQRIDSFPLIEVRR
ncbi:MAG: hypothetical protein FWF01_00830 [Alphaproteobacteria bacterium]|nr:hypothetical protein [Alphaproteobacteria bacterium]